MISNLAIRWSWSDPAEFADEPEVCTYCGSDHDCEIGPAVFVIKTWRYVCDRCASCADPDLVNRLWRMRAEIDRGECGPETQAWLDKLDPEMGGDIVRRAVAEYFAERRGRPE